MGSWVERTHARWRLVDSVRQRIVEWGGQGSSWQTLRQTRQPMSLWCGTVYEGGVREREECCLLSSWLAFSHFPHYPQANWALLVLILGWVGLCTF